MTTPELKPCPFALEEDIAGIHRPFEFRDTLRDCYVRCTCGAQGPRDRSPAGAIIGWNARPLEAAAYLRGLEAAAKICEAWIARHAHEEDYGGRRVAEFCAEDIRAAIAKEKP